jgi:hypothetical protein
LVIFIFCPDDDCKKSPRNLTPQEIGIAKLSGFSEWFSNHFIMDGFGANHNLDPKSSCQKTIIFAHHLKVLDGIQVSCFMFLIYFLSVIMLLGGLSSLKNVF